MIDQKKRIRRCRRGAADRGEQMKKIAIVLDGWRKFVTYAWIIGCRQYIKEHGLDANIYAFNSFGNFSMDEKYNIGEYNITNLPNFSDFDGIIVDLTNIKKENREIKEDIIRRIRESGVPAVSLVERIPGMYYSGINNYAAMKEIVEHIVTVHGCTKINFVGGPRENEENQLRFEAYCDVLAEHGIPFERERVYEYNFEIVTGEQAFDHFEEKGLIPEVFICANDNIAVGLCHQAQGRGYRIPEDFLVTGFDNFDKASYYVPSITTVGVIREKTAYQAAELLDKIWRGEECANEVYVDSEIVFQDSCGCKAEHPRDRGEYVRENIFAADYEIKIQNDMLLLKRALIDCQTFEEMAECLPQNLQMLNYEELYILMNKNLLGDSEEILFDMHTVEDDYPTKGYPEDMEVFVASRGKEILHDCKRKPGQLIPGDAESSGGDLYLFLPVHFRDREIGYMVLKNCDDLMNGQMIFEVLNVFLEAMENMYHRSILSRMNQELSMLYMMDSMTGLYNRMAYNRLAVPLFEQCVKNGNPILIMFVDVDRLKYINDNFGHDMGNIAIKTVSSAIQKFCPQEGVAMRYGGDEFVVLVPKYDQAMAEDMVAKMYQMIDSADKSLNTNFPIEASIGFVIAENGEKNLNDCINLADEKMYEVKKAKKVQRNQ